MKKPLFQNIYKFMDILWQRYNNTLVESFINLCSSSEKYCNDKNKFVTMHDSGQCIFCANLRKFQRFELNSNDDNVRSQ